MTTEERQATPDELRRHMLRQAHPHAYGNETEQKAARKAAKAAGLTAAEKEQQERADRRFSQNLLKSTVLLGDRDALQAQHAAARATSREEPDEQPLEVTPEQQAALDALKAMQPPPA